MYCYEPIVVTWKCPLDTIKPWLLRSCPPCIMPCVNHPFLKPFRKCFLAFPNRSKHQQQQQRQSRNWRNKPIKTITRMSQTPSCMSYHVWYRITDHTDKSFIPIIHFLVLPATIRRTIPPTRTSSSRPHQHFWRALLRYKISSMWTWDRPYFYPIRIDEWPTNNFYKIQFWRTTTTTTIPPPIQSCHLKMCYCEILLP